MCFIRAEASEEQQLWRELVTTLRDVDQGDDLVRCERRLLSKRDLYNSGTCVKPWASESLERDLDGDDSSEGVNFGRRFAEAVVKLRVEIAEFVEVWSEREPFVEEEPQGGVVDVAFRDVGRDWDIDLRFDISVILFSTDFSDSFFKEVGVEVKPNGVN